MTDELLTLPEHPAIPEEEGDALSLKEKRQLEAIREELELLAESEVEGIPTAEALQKLLGALPASLRPIARKRYAALLTEIRKDFGLDPEHTLSTGQKAMLEEIKKIEQPSVVQAISRASLRRIRGLFLSHPKVVEAILHMGQALVARGVGRIESSQADIAVPSVPSAATDKSTGVER